MVYNNNIPQPTDRPSDSQSDLLANFQDLKTFLDRNHEAIVDPSVNLDEGKHIYLQMPEQGVAPTTAADEGALYTKVSGTATQLFFREESNGAERQLTGIAPTSTVAPAYTTYSFTLGGIIFNYGTISHSGTTTAVLFDTAYSNTNYALTLGPLGIIAAYSPNWDTPTVNGFNFKTASSITGQCRFIVIGI